MFHKVRHLPNPLGDRLSVRQHPAIVDPARRDLESVEEGGRTMKRLATVGLIVLFVALAVRDARAELPGLLQDMTPRGLLKQAEDSVNKIVDNAGKEARATIMEAAIQMRLLIQSLSLAYADVLDVTFKKIAEERRTIFESSWQSLEKLDLMSRDRTKEVQQIVDTGAAAIRSIPFSDRTPRVIRVEPAYFTEQQIRTGTVVRVTGISLAESNPTLQLAGRTLERNEKLENSLASR